MTNLFNYNLAGKVDVAVAGTKFHNNVQKFITVVTDTVEGSPTKGWAIEYTPRLNSQGELYEPSQTLNSIAVPNFGAIQEQVFGAVIAFASDAEVNAEIAANKQRVRRVYEAEGNPFRITVSKQRNSFYVLLRVIDTTSPFYMVALEFTVTPDRMNPNVPYIVGIGQRLNAQTGVYTTFDAFFVDSKRMFIEVYRNDNQYNLAQTVITGQSQNGYTIDNRASSIQYIQKVDTVFKAQAFIVEQAIMEYAFAIAKDHTAGLQQAPQVQGGGFANFFGAPQQQAAPQFGGQPQLGQQPAPQFGGQPQFGGGFQAPQQGFQAAPVMNQQFQGFQPGQMFNPNAGFAAPQQQQAGFTAPHQQAAPQQPFQAPQGAVAPTVADLPLGI